MRVELDGLVALFVDAFDELGKTLADAFVANGATVIQGRSGAGEMATSDGAPEPRRMTHDVEDSVSMAEDLVRQRGRIDILVNNAASPPADPRALARLCVAFAEPSATRRYGRIINLVSVLGLIPARGEGDRSADAAAIISLTRTLAMELAPRGILVNALAIGALAASDNRERALADRLLSHVPTGRPGELADFANAALFLADPANSYMTGHTLTVDGGWLAGYARNF